MKPTPAKQALALIDGHVIAVVNDETDPYSAAVDIWKIAFYSTRDGEEGSRCKGLWLQWGALTDWVERKPQERGVAIDAIRRAARGWLEAGQDLSLQHTYLDRWLYDELGYERPERA